MKTILWSARWTTAKGWQWKAERECLGTGEGWKTVFQRDEPEVLFTLSEKAPSKRILKTLQNPSI